MTVRHPDYVTRIYLQSQPRFVYGNGEDAVSYEDLANGTARFALDPGVLVRGHVLDSAGAYISGAEVADSKWWPRDPRDTRATDETGGFTLRHATGEGCTLIVRAKGHVPILLALAAEDLLEPVEIRLGFPGVVSGRVVDSSGKPLEGVTIVGTPKDTEPSIQHSTESDSDGRFRWDTAPPNQMVKMDFWKFGYFAHMEDHRVSDNGADLVVTLEPAREVQGTVVDAETGAPVSRFALIPVYGGSADMAFVSRDHPDGRFSISYLFPVPPFSLRIEANGYAAYHSPSWAGADQIPGALQVSLNPRPLEPVHEVTGQVRLPDGGGATGAQIKVLADSSYPWVTLMGSGLLRDGHGVGFTQADARGRFRLRSTTNATYAVAYHKGGFGVIAMDPRQNQATIDLKPWSRIEGRVLHQPPGDVFRHISISSHIDRVDIEREADSAIVPDAEGRFVVDQVPPGKCGISFMVGAKRPGEMFGMVSIAAVLQPGETTTVQLGDPGRRIAGKLVRPNAIAEQAWDELVKNIIISLHSPIEPIPYPDDLPDEQKWEWRRTYETSEEEIRRWSARRSYQAMAGEDGSFAFPGVLPGAYVLDVNERFSPQLERRKFSSIRKDVTVPEAQGPDPNALDLGAFDLQMKVEAGMPAPAFSVTTLDGKVVALADFKGRYLLLDCWATWCGPCLVETPHLKAIHDTFGSDPRFAMVGLSWDRQEKPLRDSVASTSLAWPQALLTEDQRTAFNDGYGVDSIPAIFLIGPDGTILARDLRGEAMRDAVQSALGEGGRR